jgi:uncharacterized protein (UPF0335 family)
MKQFCMDKKVSLRLDAGIVDRLQAYADKERVPVSYVLRHLVIRFLAGPPAPCAGVPALGQIPGDRSRFAPEQADTRRVAVAAHADREKAKFLGEVCTIFDAFRSQGFDVKESARRTNFALKAKSHPWATYEVIADLLRKTGRFRTVRMATRKQPA